MVEVCGKQWDGCAASDLLVEGTSENVTADASVGGAVGAVEVVGGGEEDGAAERGGERGEGEVCSRDSHGGADENDVVVDGATRDGGEGFWGGGLAQ